MFLAVTPALVPKGGEDHWHRRPGCGHKNEHQATLLTNANARMTQAAIDASLTGAKRTSYGGCPVASTAAACGGSAKGLLPRSDSYVGHDYVGHDYVEFYRDNGAPVRFDGGTGILQ